MEADAYAIGMKAWILRELNMMESDEGRFMLALNHSENSFNGKQTKFLNGFNQDMVQCLGFDYADVEADVKSEELFDNAKSGFQNELFGMSSDGARQSLKERETRRYLKRIQSSANGEAMMLAQLHDNGLDEIIRFRMRGAKHTSSWLFRALKKSKPAAQMSREERMNRMDHLWDLAHEYKTMMYAAYILTPEKIHEISSKYRNEIKPFLIKEVKDYLRTVCDMCR